MPEVVAAIDFGGSGLRAAAFDRDGTRVALARRRWSGRPAEGTEHGTEFDGPEVWAHVADALAEATAGHAVRGIGVTAVRLGCALIGDEGEVYCGPNVDGRGRIEGLELWREHGDALYRLSGHAPPVASASARLRWFARHQPDRLARARHLVPLEGWLAWRLTGVVAGEPAACAATGLLDVAQRRWSPELCAMTGADARLLPPMYASGSPVGDADGVPVTIAGGDTHAGLLALGALDPGTAGIVAGATAPLMAVTDRWVHDEAARCWTEPHPLDARWVVESNVGEVGGPTTWVASLLGVDVAELDALVREAPPGANGVLAFLGPMAMHSTNMPLLRRGGIDMLLTYGAQPSRADVARAFVENIAFALRTARAWAGGPIGAEPALRLGGGVSRLRSLAQVLADVTASEVLVADDPEVTLRGAAAAAAAAAGWHATLREAACSFATPMTAVAPVDSAAYEGLFDAWSAAAEARVLARFDDLTG